MISGSGGMANLAKETRRKVDEAMSVIEEHIIKATAIDMASLRPQITDKEAFDQLLVVVNESTQRNYSIAELQEKISVLGTNVKNTAIEAASIIEKVMLS
jgi:rhodanese-related sulfurtransferase